MDTRDSKRPIWQENPKLYEIARDLCHEFGMAWTDPRTGVTYPPPVKDKPGGTRGGTRGRRDMSPAGPGKYDNLCTLVRERAHANGAAVLIFEGKDGDGFSVQAPLDIQLTLPQRLRVMADEIERAMFPDAQ